MLIAAAVTAASRQQLMNTGLLVFVAVVLHNALGMLFGFLVAKWSGMNLAKCKCMAFEVGMQNWAGRRPRLPFTSQPIR